jgi:F-type H+-transporting ATPase subunit b
MEFNPTVFLLQLGTFLIGMWLSALIFLPYLKGWMRDRQKRIEEQIRTAENLQKDAENLKADFEAKAKSLEKTTTDTIQKARNEASKMREEITHNARKEAEQIISDARKAIESERQAVTQAIQKEMGTLAVTIAEKIIRSSVDAKVQEKIVQESLKELGTRKN